MNNFTIDNPTVVHFGRGVLTDLGSTVAKIGHRVLLVYGKGSIRRNGIYDMVMQQMQQEGLEVMEYSGIRPNPVVGDVDMAAEAGRRFRPDVILAVGGGSVLDSAKIIAITIPVKHTGWLFMSGKAKPVSAVPLVTVLTLAATGSEMNRFAVLQNHKTMEKVGYGHHLMYPRHSFLDPSLTFSVSREYTAYGISDLTAHVLESFFGEGDASLSDRFVYAVIREAMEYGPALLNDLQSYPLREKIMYAATCALNGLTFYGRASGDWGVHAIGHVISLLYDTPHGATLSIAYPAWLKRLSLRIPDRIATLGQNLFGVTTTEQTIEELERFFRRIQCPVRLPDAGIGEEKKAEVLGQMLKNETDGMNHKLTEEDIRAIVDHMFTG
ncbi:MAG: iron-containing alcohol dehydrogenase [Bacteroidales bacterium]|nr:iron-containing alcohol dehydrogenase [Bacteroidales bacterium]